MNNLDVVFGIGINDQMTENDFTSLKNFVFTTIHRSNIDFGMTRFGFYLFDKEVITESVILLKQHSSRADLIYAIDSIPYKPSSSQVHLSTGLQFLQVMFTSINGARTGISNKAIIMLDSNVNISDSSVIAGQLKFSSISLQFITVGYHNVTELEQIDNTDDSIQNVHSYGVLEWILKTGIYKDGICGKYIYLILINSRLLNPSK